MNFLVRDGKVKGLVLLYDPATCVGNSCFESCKIFTSIIVFTWVKNLSLFIDHFLRDSPERTAGGLPIYIDRSIVFIRKNSENPRNLFLFPVMDNIFEATIV